MLKIKISYLGPIRNATRCKEEEVTILEGSTVQQLLSQLMEKYGEPFHEYLVNYVPPGSNVISLAPPISIFYDGRNIETLGGTETKLTSEGGLEIMFIPVIDGG